VSKITLVPVYKPVMRGTVKEWSEDEGWGVLVSPELSGTVFAHHIHIRGQDGYRSFAAGDAVIFETDGHGGQDGCDHRALWVELDAASTAES
jgi:CspA family cold shock protein